MPDGETNDIRTERIVFSGRVQGVGFRFATRGIARRFSVVGFVRNRSDGTVEIVIRGNENSVNEVVRQIAEHFCGNITGIDRVPVEFDEPFLCFEIRH